MLWIRDLWKRCADIFLCVIYSKVMRVCGDIHKAVFIIICALVRVSCLGRYLKVKDDLLHIEAATFCVIQYIQKILYYSEILSGINTYFEQVYERHSSCDFECNLFFFIRAKYEPSFLEKIIFYRQ